MKVQNHFEKKARNYYNYYYQADVKNCHVHNQRVRRQYFKKLLQDNNYKQGMLALDIGTGPGSITKELKGFGFDTFGIDISFEMLLNNRKNTSQDVKLAQCSGDSICYRDNSFDIITAAGVLEYVQEDKKMLSQILRALKPEGTLIISVPIKSIVSSFIRIQLGRILFRRPLEQFYHKGYTPNSIRQIMEEAGFKIMTTISHHFVFFPFDYLLPKLSMKNDYFLTRLFKTNAIFARFGKTLIIKAIKPTMKT